MIRKESNLADLITGAGLLGSSHASEAGSTTSADVTAEQQALQRPCSAPLSQSNSSFRRLSRANSRAATILGLQASTSRRSRNSSAAGKAVAQEDWDACPGQVKRSSSAKQGRISWQEQQCAGDQASEQVLQQLQQHNQQLLQQLEHVQQQLQFADATQHNLEQQLQQQAADNQIALQDLQVQHDNSSKKLFRDLKAAQAAKDQALAGKRSAEQATRDMQQELAAVQSKCQQQQQQLASLEERLATTARKLEQQAHVHEEASRKAAGKAERKVQQLKEQLLAKEATIKEAEHSIRQELHRRTGTILSMQAQLEQQNPALEAAAVQQAELHSRIQELQAQLTCPPAANHSQAEGQPAISNQSFDEQSTQHRSSENVTTASQCNHISFGADAASNSVVAGLTSIQQQSLHKSPAGTVQAYSVMQQHAACDGSTTTTNSTSVLSRQLQVPPAGQTACSGSSAMAAAAAQLAIADTLQECRSSVSGSRGNSRSVTASAQLMRQSLGAWEETGGASGAAAVKALAGQVQGLTAALAAAAKHAADAREKYARNLTRYEAAVTAAEVSAASCWQAYDITFTAVVKRVAILLQSQCEGLAVPFHRPRSAARNASRPAARPISASAAAVSADEAAAAPDAHVANASSTAVAHSPARCSPGRRPVSAATATSSCVPVGSSSSGVTGDCRADSPDRQSGGSPRYGGSNIRRPHSAAAAASWGWSPTGGKQQQQFNSRPASAASPCGAGVAATSNGLQSSGPAMGITNWASSNSSKHALNQMNQRLCDENAWLLVELGKWEAGHHQKQVALAAANSQQARSNLVPGGNSSTSNASIACAASTSAGGRDPACKANSTCSAAVLTRATDTVPGTSRSSGSSTGIDASTSDSAAVEVREMAPGGAAQSTGPVADAMDSAGIPVKLALRLAVKEALQACTGPVLPALLLSGLSAAAGGGVNVDSSHGWAAVGSSRLDAALSAAEINMNLRTRVLQLESALANRKATHAADETDKVQQQQHVQELEQQQKQLIQQLESARLQAEEAQEKAQQSWQVAAAEVRQGGQGSSTTRTAHAVNLPTNPANHQCDGTSLAWCDAGVPGGGGSGNDSSSTALVPGIAADDRLTCGAGFMRDLPIAAQQEIVAQRRIAAAAKRDKEARSRELTQFELRYSSLAAKLVKSRQAVLHRETQIAQLQQALSAAHMALLDAGLDCQQQGWLTAAAVGCEQQQQQSKPGSIESERGSDSSDRCHTQQAQSASVAAAAGGSAASGSHTVLDDDIMNVALSCEQSLSSCCSSRLTRAASNASVLGVNAAAAASWGAAMEARDRTQQIQRLTGVCADKQAKVEHLQQELKKLQQQLARQQRAANAALAAVQAEATSRRESLAGDLEGATTAMQEATRKLAASELECNTLRQQLTAAERLQQQLELDVAYLRGRRAAVTPPAAHQPYAAGSDSNSAGTC